MGQVKLTEEHQNRVREAADPYELNDSFTPEEIVQNAIEAHVKESEPEPITYEILDAAAIGYAEGGTWWEIGSQVNGQSGSLTGDRAREILTEARLSGIYEGPIPTEDNAAQVEGEKTIKFSINAWNSNVRGPDVRKLLNLAGVLDGDKIVEPGQVPPKSEVQDVPPETQEEHLPEVQEPWAGYSEMKVPAIKEVIDDENEFSADFLETLDHVQIYENAHKGRTRVLKYVEELKVSHEEGQSTPEDQAPSGEEAEQGEKADSDTPEDEQGGKARLERGEEDSEGHASSNREHEADAETESRAEVAESSVEDRLRECEAESPEEDSGDSDYREVIADAEQKVKEQRLHIPGPPQEDPPQLPDDLTHLSDKAVQQFYGMFSAFAYRANYLMMLEEAKAHNCREAANELYRAGLVHFEKYDDHGKGKTLEVLKAEIESSEHLKRWRKRQRRHEAFAESYRSERDSYYKLVDALSRLETMRDNEFQRSGGKRR